MTNYYAKGDPCPTKAVECSAATTDNSAACFCVGGYRVFRLQPDGVLERVAGLGAVAVGLGLQVDSRGRVLIAGVDGAT